MSARYRVILPVQELHQAMPRSGLWPEERARLSHAFAADTLDAIRQCRSVYDIVVVSPDPGLAALAVDNGARFIPTEPGTGLNAAVDHAHAQTRDDSPQMVAAIVSDLPALQPDELEEVLAAAGRRHESVYATDLGDAGVTFQAERVATFEACLAPDPARRQRPRGSAVTAAPGLRCDVDTCDGLRIASYVGLGNATRRALHDLGDRILRRAETR
ncbi:hypothetical protein DDE18_21470 [Nocardioides gansuensis]|uniref:2-phospho-L-lactate guanylyltransferase n=1 Tax=Nocardioides gansuensis TaxID=2138300 RepID=A0A2T8F544_9ACTN|nr:NTP transferase domain-containing protein [Nocardioides gansuensis]PVG80822.1 hypothetical protein DDE18_21470 [Nocardioides gansuensis]